MKWNRDDVDKYKTSEESKPFNISAFIDKKQAAFETAPVDIIGLKDPIKTFVQKLLLAQEMALNKTFGYAIKGTR